MPYSITRKTVSEQTVLVQRKRVKQGPDISQAISDGLAAVFTGAHQRGFEITGRPFARYPEVTPEHMTIEPGVPIAAPGGGAGGEAPSDPEAVRVDVLPAGAAAFTVHRGHYDTLHEAYAALEKWIEDQGLSPSGSPWEVYITDPTQVKDPADWETEVYWPVD